MELFWVPIEHLLLSPTSLLLLN